MRQAQGQGVFRMQANGGDAGQWMRLQRAGALQAHPLTGVAAVGLHPEDALALGLTHGAQARVSGDGGETVLPVVVTRSVPRGGAWIESAWAETSSLPPAGAAMTVARASG